MQPDELKAQNKRLLSALVKVGAECHRAKWQFDDDKDPTGIVAFRELHRIGDIAKAAIDTALQPGEGT